MTPFLGVLRKELKITFTTPVAYSVFFLFSVVASALFWLKLTDYEATVQKTQHMDDLELLGQLNFTDLILSPLFANVLFIFVIIVPILTMRTFAEEKRQRTMELLMTTPIEPWQVVLAKYLAMLVTVGCIVGLMLIYPVILHVFGSNSMVGQSVVDWPTTLLGIFGTFLAAAMFAAVGLFFSSTTENQVVAAVVSALVLFLMLMLARAGAELPGWPGDVVTFLAPTSHILTFSRGLFDLQDTLYYVSVAGFFLFFTQRAFESQRWT